MLWSVPVNKPLGQGPLQVPGLMAAPGSQLRCCCPVPRQLGWAHASCSVGPTHSPSCCVTWRLAGAACHASLALPPLKEQPHDYTQEATSVDLRRDLLAGGGKGCGLPTLRGKLVTSEEHVGVSTVLLSLICINV